MSTQYEFSAQKVCSIVQLKGLKSTRVDWARQDSMFIDRVSGFEAIIGRSTLYCSFSGIIFVNHWQVVQLNFKESISGILRSNSSEERLVIYSVWLDLSKKWLRWTRIDDIPLTVRRIFWILRFVSYISILLFIRTSRKK